MGIMSWYQNEVSRLRGENASLREQLGKLTERLDTETERNRLREDALVDRLIAISSSSSASAARPVSLPARTSPLPDEMKKGEEDDDEFSIVTQSPIPRDAIIKRAKEFYEQAKANGYNYDFELLVKHLEDNPEYLVN